MRPFLAYFAILSVVQLVTAGALAGQDPWSTPHEDDQGPAKLTLCNHGDRSVSVALGTIDVDAFRHSLTISGWTNVKAGTCDVIYLSEHNLSVPLQSYLAFAYFNQGQFTPAQVTSTPDIGEFSYYETAMLVRYPHGHGPALTTAVREQWPARILHTGRVQSGLFDASGSWCIWRAHTDRRAVSLPPLGAKLQRQRVRAKL